MESHSTIIGVLIALIVLLPLIIIQATQKKEKKKSRKSFKEEALKNNLIINESDFWGTYYAIAIDETANKLIYSKIIGAEHQSTIIDLGKVTSCEIVRTQRAIRNKTTSKIETDKIDLVIINKTKTKDILEFYNVDVNVEMTTEIALLEKWETKIKSRLLKEAHAA